MADAMKGVESVVGYCQQHDWVPFLRMTDAAWSHFANRHRIVHQRSGFRAMPTSEYDPAGPTLHPVPHYNGGIQPGPKHICEHCLQEARKQKVTDSEHRLQGI